MSIFIVKFGCPSFIAALSVSSFWAREQTGWIKSVLENVSFGLLIFESVIVKDHGVVVIIKTFMIINEM